MKDVLSAIRERSSTRGYTEQMLAKEEIDALVAAALQAPTAANRQEVHVTVVGGGHPVLEKIEEEMRKSLARTPDHNFYYGAPTVLFLSADSAFAWSAVDAGIAVQNVSLAAEGMGLGSLIIGCIRGAMAGERKAEFAKALGFPEGYAFEVAVAVGHKAVCKEPHAYSAERNVTVI